MNLLLFMIDNPREHSLQFMHNAHTYSRSAHQDESNKKTNEKNCMNMYICANRGMFFLLLLLLFLFSIFHIFPDL